MILIKRMIAKFKQEMQRMAQLEEENRKIEARNRKLENERDDYLSIVTECGNKEAKKSSKALLKQKEMQRSNYGSCIMHMDAISKRQRNLNFDINKRVK